MAIRVAQPLRRDQPELSQGAANGQGLDDRDPDVEPMKASRRVYVASLTDIRTVPVRRGP
jgi:hypothetical protein